jgi:hypothetical protein
MGEQMTDPKALSADDAAQLETAGGVGVGTVSWRGGDGKDL